MQALIVAANIIKTGGMDRANYALALQFAGMGIETHLVAHSVSKDLVNVQNIRFHRVPMLLDSDSLSEIPLGAVGRRWAKKVASDGGRVVVNGGIVAGRMRIWFTMSTLPIFRNWRTD
jgi:hypothetical protein